MYVLHERTLKEYHVHLFKKILFLSLKPLRIYISIVARPPSAATFCLQLASVSNLRLRGHAPAAFAERALPPSACPVLQVSLRYNLSLIPPPPPCSPLHVSHLGRATERKGAYLKCYS